MKLKDVEKTIITIANEHGNFIEKDGVVINPESIDHYVIIHTMKDVSYSFSEKKENKKPVRRRRRVVVKEEEPKESAEENKDDVVMASEIEEEEIISNGDIPVNMDDESLNRLIARKRNISEASSVVLTDNGWFICPIVKGYEFLYPCTSKYISSTKSYKIVIGTKSIAALGTTLDDSNYSKWHNNSVSFINDCLESGCSIFKAKSVFVNKHNGIISKLVKDSLTQLDIAQKTRIKQGNILITTVSHNVGNELYSLNKEHLTNRMKAIGKKNPSVKIIDEIESAFKRINIKVDEMGKKVPISLEKTFKTVVDAVVEDEKDTDIVFMNEYKKYIKEKEDRDISDEEAKEATKTLYSSDYISSFTIYHMCNIYETYVHTEAEAVKAMKDIVHKHPLWDKYLAGIKGCGEKTTAMCISYLDIEKTVHASSFLRYLGLDQVIDKPVRKEGEVPSETDKNNIIEYLEAQYNEIYRNMEENNFASVNSSPFIYASDGVKTYEQFKAIEKVHNMDNFENADSDDIIDSDPVYKELVNYVWNNITIIHTKIGNEIVPICKKRARSKKDTVIDTYLDSSGKLKTKKSLGYNARVKSFFVMVLFDSMIKASSPYYIGEVYTNYRNRVENRFKAQGKDPEENKAHIFNMARRFTIQRFIEDLWIKWREIEGLPTNGGTYYEAKIGSHLNGIRK